MLDLYNTNANPLPFRQRDTSNPAALQPTIPEPASLLSINWGMAFLFRHYMKKGPFLESVHIQLYEGKLPSG